MYNEFRGDSKRTSWIYTYSGIVLMPFAQNKLKIYAAAETVARQKVAELLLDPNVSSSDKRISDAKNEVETNGTIHEQLKVWVHEFRRAADRGSDREFHLSLSDVVFFGIV